MIMMITIVTEYSLHDIICQTKTEKFLQSEFS